MKACFIKHDILKKLRLINKHLKYSLKNVRWIIALAKKKKVIEYLCNRVGKAFLNQDERHKLCELLRD